MKNKTIWFVSLPKCYCVCSGRDLTRLFFCVRVPTSRFGRSAKDLVWHTLASDWGQQKGNHHFELYPFVQFELKTQFMVVVKTEASGEANIVCVASRKPPTEKRSDHARPFRKRIYSVANDGTNTVAASGKDILGFEAYWFNDWKKKNKNDTRNIVALESMHTMWKARFDAWYIPAPAESTNISICNAWMIKNKTGPPPTVRRLLLFVTSALYAKKVNILILLVISVVVVWNDFVHRFFVGLCRKCCLNNIALYSNQWELILEIILPHSFRRDLEKKRGQSFCSNHYDTVPNVAGCKPRWSLSSTRYRIVSSKI